MEKGNREWETRNEKWIKGSKVKYMGNGVPDNRPLTWVLVKFVPTSHFPLLRAHCVPHSFSNIRFYCTNRVAYKLTFLSDEYNFAKIGGCVLHQKSK